MTLTSTGETQSGNSIEVDEGADVTYSVAKEGYTTKTATVSNVEEDKTIAVILELTPSDTDSDSDTDTDTDTDTDSDSDSDSDSDTDTDTDTDTNP